MKTKHNIRENIREALEFLQESSKRGIVESIAQTDYAARRGPNEHILVKVVCRELLRGNREMLGEITEFFTSLLYRLEDLDKERNYQRRRINELERKVKALTTLALSDEWDEPEEAQDQQEEEEVTRRTDVLSESL